MTLRPQRSTLFPYTTLFRSRPHYRSRPRENHGPWPRAARRGHRPSDRKSTRLNSSHMSISYAVFCLKKKRGSEPPLGDTSPEQAEGLLIEAAFRAIMFTPLK